MTAIAGAVNGVTVATLAAMESALLAMAVGRATVEEIDMGAAAEETITALVDGLEEESMVEEGIAMVLGREGMAVIARLGMGAVILARATVGEAAMEVCRRPAELIWSDLLDQNR